MLKKDIIFKYKQCSISIFYILKNWYMKKYV